MKLKLWSCVLVAGISARAIAQTGSTGASAIPADQLLTAPNGVTAQCMARTTTQSEHANWPLVVPATSANQAAFAAKGFVPAPCGSLATDLVTLKADMCNLAQGNDAVQRRTEQVFGIDARKLCAAVTLLLPDATKQIN